MTRRSFDADIDVKSGTNKDAYGVRSFVYNEERMTLVPHPSAHFLPSKDLIDNDIPIDPVTGLTSMDAKEGEDFGFFKVDLLTNTSYDGFNNKQEVLDSLDFSDFEWDVFLYKDIVEQLPHISKHFSMVHQLRPQSVEDLADVLALIRPGKVDLVDEYLRDKEKTRKRLYKRPADGGMYFKLSHSIGYAVLILIKVKQMDREANSSDDMWGIS